MSVRTLRAGEAMPEGFATGFENLPLQADWVWIAEKEGIPVGVLLAAPCHGIIYIARLCLKEVQNKMVAVALLRALFRDTKARGYLGYLFHINPMREVEREMIPLCKRAGGVQVTMPQLARSKVQRGSNA